MQAILTKYLAPTTHRGARISATCAAGKIIVPWDYELGVRSNHQNAAKALRTKLGWKGGYVSGQLPKGDYAHCFLKG